MRTMTGEGLDTGLEVPALGKLGGFSSESGDTGWILVSTSESAAMQP